MTKHIPLVSIGLLVYNGEKYIEQALNSLLSQDYENIELIISDNASTDGTEAICREYARKNSRIRYYRNQTNIGVLRNFKRVSDLALGEFFMWAACDDWWDPAFVSTLQNALEEHPDHGVAMSSIIRVHENGSLFDIVPLTGENDVTRMNYDEVFKRMMRLTEDTNKWFLHIFIYGLFRTDLLRQFLSRPFPGCRAGDRVFMCEVALATRFCSVPRILYRRTVRKTSIADRYSQDDLGKKWRAKNNFFGYIWETLTFLLSSRNIPWKRKIRLVPVSWLSLLWNFRDQIAHELFPNSLWLKRMLSKKHAAGKPLDFTRIYRECNGGDSDLGAYLLRCASDGRTGVQQAAPGAVSRRLCSIVIPVYNQVEYTKQCLEAIIENTPEDLFEVIIIDNASTDGTKEFLSCLEGDLRIVTNEQNMGFAHACNQGIGLARGNYVMILNNDVIVTKGWLERLITHVDSDPAVGMAGPVSNSVSGPQFIENVPYGSDLTQMHAFAARYAEEHAGKTQDALRLVGFCLLVKKEVIELIGGFDEGYANGNFEDDDLCLRSAIAGFRHLIAKDVFVHHFGSMTFKGNSMDYLEHMEKNKQYFFSKWNRIITPTDGGYEMKFTDENKNLYTDIIISWGEDLFSRGNLKQAVLLFKRALAIQPDNPKAINNLGVVLWQTGDAQSAISVFSSALSHAPENADAFANLARAVQESGRYDLIDRKFLQKLGIYFGNTDEYKNINAQLMNGAR